MGGIFSRLRRKVLLALLSRQTPAKLLWKSRARLARAVARTTRRSPAYRLLLEEAGVRFDSHLAHEQLLASLPVLDKAALYGRFNICDLLASDLGSGAIGGVLTSSGYGGGNFAFGVSGRAQLRQTPDDIDLGLELAFGIDSRSTLLVNCLPMGVVFSSNAVCVANVSVREDMALAILRQVGPLFEQVILCLDPLFSKRLLDYAAEQSFDWSSLRTNAIIGEEMFSEDYRSYLAEHLQVDIDRPGSPMLGSSMGVGELGLNLFFEVPETIALRRALHRRSPDQLLPVFFCFNPLRTFVEVLAPGPDGVGDLVISMLSDDAPFPMIRYRTGDRARWLTEADTAGLDTATRTALARQPFPMLAILGRDRDRIDDHWHVDHFKALLYRDSSLAAHLSGAFVASREAEGLRLSVQLGCHSTRDPAGVAAALAELVEASARRRSAPPPGVKCYAYPDFPHAMGLDYERKFRYFPGS